MAGSLSNGELTLKGTIITTFFQSNDSFYKVLLVNVKEANFDWKDTEIVVIGDFADIAPETDYIFYGELVDHPKYGKQFRANNYETDKPTSKVGLVAYLSGNEFPGIGKKTAEKVVDDLGDNLIADIISNPDIIKSTGINNKQADTIVKGIQSTNGAEQIIIGLNNYGFGSQLASKIYNRYHEETLKVIKKNPYQLVEDVRGISFKKADNVARQMGFKADSAGRIRAGVMTALKDLSIKEGGTYTSLKQLINETFNLLNSSSDVMIKMQYIADQIMELATDGKIIGDGDSVYLTSLYEDELNIAENIKRLQDAGDDTQEIAENKIDKTIDSVSNYLKIKYDDSQVHALKMAMKSSFFLLTGGPGTGKTTIIKGIIMLYAKLHHLSMRIDDYDDSFPFLLAAPTGRAAKRMKETTGVEASTIHRLLGLNGRDDNETVDMDQTIDGKLLIIDEMSMVDTQLFNLLLNAIPDNMKVILVGDKDQLPSVGPGQVFHDLIDSNVIPKIELNKIHRQGKNSTIVELAHAIRKGHLPDDFISKEPDRSFIRCNSSQVDSAIGQIVEKAHAKKFDSMDMQVLAPMYRGEVGINNLNQVIQNILNPKKSAQQKEVSDRNFTYRIGDKVLQLVNDSENNVFNGDIGKIVGIDINPKNKSNDKLIIAFDEIEVTYSRKDWDQITLAYCTSIHKAQGCEFKMVILPMVPQYSRMLQRNLLYTAITRASDVLVLLGDYDSFKRCVESQGINRSTGLEIRLKAIFEHSDSNKEIDKETDDLKKEESLLGPKILTNTLIREHKINPLIGMDGVTPQDYNS